MHINMPKKRTGIPVNWKSNNNGYKPGECYTRNVHRPWFCYTADDGWVFLREVADVVLCGGNILPDGKMGMIMTVDRVITITSELATVLALQDKLHELFSEL